MNSTNTPSWRMDRGYDKGHGTCPVCRGTGHMPCPGAMKEFAVKYNWYGYRPQDDTVTCTNCGGQYQFAWTNVTGQVRLNRRGQPCTHDYASKTIGNCLTEYICTECGDRHQVDSGD